MNPRAPITCLLLAAAVGTHGFAAPPAAKKPLPKRTELFIGYPTAGWLPKAPILPAASDIESNARRLSSRVRNVDPFALPTFPREEDLKAAATNLDRQSEKVTLNQALQSLQVTGINLEKREILFRGRNVFEGDVMVLSFKDELFLAQIVEVGATQILFRDVRRQETGVLPHTLLPQLELEPVHKRAGLNGLEGKVSPMETTQSFQQ
jgi:hypothetical protein